jgi:alkylated DNA repair dioxygenase AlkB
VYPSPLTENNSVALVIYEKKGDSIGWHFDTNMYDGRFFTLLLPVTFEKTCGKYEYKNADEQDRSVELQQGQALLFEGEKVFHQGRPLCENETRILLSCTFTTTQHMPFMNAAFQKMKNWSLYGFNP